MDAWMGMNEGVHTWFGGPEFRAYLKMSDLVDPGPAMTWMLIDEHPDSINDGYFLNKGAVKGWTDLPASYHNGAVNLSYADGHAEIHRWVDRSTKPPPLPDAAGLPFSLAENERTDYYWLLRRMSTYQDDDGH
jgi:prepilin-type processing-associated H-X9-DG protein